MRYLHIILFFIFIIINNTNAQNTAIDLVVKNEIKGLADTYYYLHQNPEVSLCEKNTAAYLVQNLAKRGIKADANVGGNGVVVVLENGKGPTVLVRADIDALPVKEETGVAYASKITMKDHNGKEVPAMHACGHDIHMSVWLGTIVAFNAIQNWKGKIIFVAQPAEEIVVGAKAMLDEGLYKKYGKPDFCLALHDASDMQAGKIGYCLEYAMASVNSINITVKGVSGHGAYPHNTVDPIVMSAKLILDLQTIISRDIPAIEPAVLTVGTIHGGTKRNIIANETRLELTLRTYNDKIKDLIIEKIREKAKGVAVSEGLPESLYPDIEITPEHSPALYNNPILTARLVPAFENAIGKANVTKVKPVMVSEDFGHFGLEDNSVPVFLFWLGAVEPKKYESYKSQNKILPSLHSSTFLPEPVETISTGIRSMSGALLELLKE